MASPVHTYFYSMVEIGVVKFFVDHGIYRAIPLEENTSISYVDLAAKVGVELSLLERFTNFLIAAKALDSPAPGHVAHTPSSKVFIREDASRFYQHVFDFFLVSAAHWPEYFSAHGPAEPKEADKAPYGLAVGRPNETLYQILDTMPEKSAAFNATMALALAEMPATGTYDFSWVGAHAASTKQDERVLIVDVGGGQGQIIKAILEETPAIPPQRCVLEDQSDEAVHADTTGVIEKVQRRVTSFFEEQPVKGALIYHVRRVLNDWPDSACTTILSHLRAACASDSRVLVAENLVQDGAERDAAQELDHCAIDLFMMNFGGKRRTQGAYEALAEKAGLKVVHVARHKGGNGFAVLEMVPV
ncbi:S-adenosyl-L-methionine-dependent methyltransferase [Ophiobolus disseminans]|uniref:S-adenosyl-L-methionine-dependent methyltransferase n=1 Tax=Ophiobolus disseminans TaxID=1469910 RepID=A0A6A6ZDM7_9PLEO|nr:S-adenosyl-L-methionine-dependent methyltransferase [Ophiobolus disseminans]